MTNTRRLIRARSVRLALAAVLTVSLSIGFAAQSFARPSHADLVAAQAKLDALNRSLSLLVEQYDQTNIKLQAAQQQLQDAQTAAGIAQAQAAQARATLSARAAAAYEGAGSEIAVLLGSTTLSDFTDRLAFINAMARQDSDVATQAEVSREQSVRAAQQLTAAVQQRATLLAALDAKKEEIVSSIGEQKGLIKELQTQLAKPIPQPKPKILPAPVPSPTPPGGGGGGPGPSPGANAAVAAAFSAIGTPYKWGGDNPQTGFDCSGLTMWSWAQGGVSLPHSSAMQYDTVTHISVNDLEPGDLLFFYTPISHVGMYVAPGMMIDAQHPGTTVSEHAIWWQYFVGAGRPG